MSFPQLELDNFSGPSAVIQTNYGDVTVALFPDQAPKAVENFISLAKKGYYDGVVFHRIIPDFMIQGGDPTGTGMGGESIWGKSFNDEFSPELFNLRGALSMANAGPNTNDSQFFIVSNRHLNPQMAAQMPSAGYPEPIIEAYKQGGTPWLDFKHTVFGQVMDGLKVVDTIEAVATNANDKPVKDVVIKAIIVNE